MGGAFAAKDEFPQQLFNFEYLDHCTQSRIKKQNSRKLCNPCSKTSICDIPLKLAVSIVPCFNTEHLQRPINTKHAVKIKELLRNFWYQNVVKRRPEIRSFKS